MSPHSSLQRVFRVGMWVLVGAVAGCSSLSGGASKETGWDFSRPYHTLPPARAPHVKGTQSNPLEGFFALFSPKWGDVSTKSPSPTPLEGPKSKEGAIAPPSAAGWTDAISLDAEKEVSGYPLNREKSSVSLFLSEAKRP